MSETNDRSSKSSSGDPDFVFNYVQKVGTAVARIEEAVKIIKDDMLPPVAKDAREARISVFDLRSRVKALENKPIPDYKCTETERQERQDTGIYEARTKVSWLSKFVWWAMGLAVVIGGSAVSFAIVTESTSTENSTMIKNQAVELSRHEKKIMELEKTQNEDRKIYLNEIRELHSVFLTKSSSGQ